MDYSTIIGAKIRTLREERRLRLKDVAEKLAVSQSTLSEYERGLKPIPINLIITFCNLFETSPNELFGYGITSSEDKERVQSLINQILKNATYLNSQINSLSRWLS